MHWDKWQLMRPKILKVDVLDHVISRENGVISYI